MHSESITSTRKQQGISQLNRQRLLVVHRDLKSPFSVEDAMNVWQMARGQAQRTLAHLADQGWLVRVQRGLYATVPLAAARPDEWRLEPWVVASEVFAPCYIGGWSACEHWEFTEQVFRSVVVLSAAPNLRSRRPTIQGTDYVVKTIGEDKLFGGRTVWVGERRVQVSDPWRTIADILDDPFLGGGIQHVTAVLGEYYHSTHRNDAQLLAYVERLGNRTVYKRLGYLTEALGVEARDLMETCRKRMSAGYSRLDPAIAPRGTRRRRWNLQVNANLHLVAEERLPS